MAINRIFDTALKASFAIGTICTVVGAIAKLQHQPYAKDWLLVGMTVGVLFLALAVFEILNARVKSDTRMLWLAILLFTSIIGTVLYMVVGRKQLGIVAR
ncbi:MAG: hypothetical protein RL660_811 [Bacteroidota bacterium]|jgi:hypothetical protein